MTKIIILMMIAEYFGGVYPKSEALAQSYVPIVIEECDKENVDPIMMATIITFESGWRTHAVGKKRGEIGLGQLLGEAKGGSDLKTPRKQINKSVIWFAKKKKQCNGNLVRAIGAYMSGKCKALTMAKERYRFYKRYTRMKNKPRKKRNYNRIIMGVYAMRE